MITTIYTIIQTATIIAIVIIVIKKKIPAYNITVYGFFLLIMTVIASVCNLNALAGKIAEFVWVLFSIAFVKQFHNYLQTEVINEEL